MTSRSPEISIIIPAYNCEDYLQECLDSIYAQTFQNFEIIAVNDGSRDSTLEILRANERSHRQLIVIDQVNSGQGYARNRALEKAKGNFILFVDADDRIEPLTLELTHARATRDNADVVHFDWKLSSLYSSRPDTYHYYNAEVFAHKYALEGAECDELVRLNNYFSVNNLYKKSFLNKNNIKYGEGHIYEDNPFIVEVANKANRISLLHSPLYIVRQNLSSSTRSGIDTDKHYRDFLRAVNLSFDRLEPRTEHTTFYLVSYFIEKFIVYYERRVPAKYRDAYIKGFVDILSTQEVVAPEVVGQYKLLQLCLRKRVFQDKKYNFFRLLILSKVRVIPQGKKVLSKARRAKGRLSHLKSNVYQSELKKPVMSNTILFLGMDFRYALSSRYFFEDMIDYPAFRDKSIKFITSDSVVTDDYRLEPGSVEAYKWLARAEIVIAETWTPNWMHKRHDDTVWVQLWHGTPIKKMLFDSHEPEISSRKPSHKNQKYRDILRWDFLVADSEAGAEKLSRSFLFPRNRILLSGYPRVKFLLDNISNDVLKQEIKNKIGLTNELGSKKVVLYAPTWRDYNYGKEPKQSDYGYVLDVSRLADKLGEDYLVLFHDHSYLSTQAQAMGNRCIDVSNYDMQELLLIGDHLVSDFSSVIFDALPLGIPISLYVTDFDKYAGSRGVYEDIWKDLYMLETPSIEKLAENIIGGGVDYSHLREKYSYTPDVDLLKFIAELSPDKLNRKW